MTISGLRGSARDSARRLGCALAIAFAAGFGMVAALVHADATIAFDRHLLLFFRESGDPSRIIGPEWLPEALRDLTSLGSTLVLSIIVLSACGYLALKRNVGWILLILVAVGGSQIGVSLLKTVFNRSRPDLIGLAPEVFTTSFPSAHATLSACAYLTLGSVFAATERGATGRIYILSVSIFLTIAIGLSRVWLGVHWPSDVLAGWCLGAAWAILCVSIAHRM